MNEVLKDPTATKEDLMRILRSPVFNDGNQAGTPGEVNGDGGVWPGMPGML